MRNVNGEEFTYAQFIDMYELKPTSQNSNSQRISAALHNIVSDYDQYGLTVSTKAVDSEPETNADPNAVKSAAKRAAKNIQDRP